MKKLLERQKNLIRINNKRSEINLALQNGLITEDDIISLLKKDINYGVRNLQSYQSPKNKMLKNIFNCPFLLCDQEILSDELKLLLPQRQWLCRNMSVFFFPFLSPLCYCTIF